MKPRNFEMMPTSSALLVECVCIKRSFFLRETPFLSKQRRKLFVNLADVVKQRSSFDLFNLSGGQAQLNRNRPRKLANANGVAGRIRISGFDRLNHHLKKLLTTILKLMVQAVDVPNSNNRENYADQAERAKTEPALDERVEPRDETAIAARTEVVGQHAPGIEVPNLAERAIRADGRRQCLPAPN